MRKLRYRQVLRYRTKNHGKGTYKSQVRLQQSFHLEDNVPTPSISKVRELHTEIGTWDDGTSWVSYLHPITKEMRNYITTWRKGKLVAIYPKSNFYKVQLQKKLKRWKEQESRTIEFFGSMGV